MSAPASAGEGGASAPAAHELEIDVVEASGRFGMIAPIDGKVEAWIETGDDARRCKVDVHPGRKGLHLELRCTGKKEHELVVEVTREFRAGERTRVAEVARPGGSKSQVYITLR
ncbi:MAG: hypothetical protein H6710_18680 [Myxococcales bacterium]|nr:hypothetical protein [Myxococcales bacterium]MCB9706077.1 hypothetical protein [Myxococcales bacterium]